MEEALDGRMSAIYTPFSGRRDPQRAMMLQQYMVLHSQQRNIRRRLSEPSSTLSTALFQFRRDSTPDMASSEDNSTESSPSLRAKSSRSLATVPAYNLPRTTPNSSRSSSISPIAEDSPFATPSEIQQSVDEDKLFNTNHEIKSTLTDLLNCDNVRNDSKMRIWVQTRLMDAELELKRQRRRIASTPAIVLSPGDDDEERRASL